MVIYKRFKKYKITNGKILKCENGTEKQALLSSQQLKHYYFTDVNLFFLFLDAILS